MPRITDTELLQVSKATQEKLKHFTHGASLTARAGQTIRQLQLRAANDRLLLARRHLRDAKSAEKAGTPSARAIVSRAYYSMYHAARAVTYVHYQGDDHEAHSALPGKLPDDFPSCDVWKNRLKEARLDRNRADYDPYPRTDIEFHAASTRMLREAKELLALANKYIKSQQI